MTDSRKPPFLAYFARGLLIVLIAAILTYAIHVFGILDRWENDNLDYYLLTKDPKQSDNIRLVVINDDDYRDLFHNQSPLKQSKVVAIINAIAKGKPSVIGVDLDTSDWDGPGDLEFTGPIVWARDVWSDGVGYRLGKVLGQDEPAGFCAGVPAIRIDWDGVVRRASADYWELDTRLHPTFSSLLIRMFQGKECELPKASTENDQERHESEALINFLRRGYAFRRLTAKAVLTLAESEAWLADSDFSKKIVLLGGVYHPARDKYVTPVGLMDGVELVAQVAENQPSSLGEATPMQHFAIDMLIGVVLLMVLYRASPVLKIVVLGFTVLMAIFISLALFRTSAYFFSFIPVLAGLRFHESIEQFFERRHLRDENKELREKLSEREAAETSL